MARVQPPAPTAPPTPPIQRGDRATFSNRVDAAITYLTNAPAQIGNIAQITYDNAVDAFGSAGTASTAATTAMGYRDTTLTYRNEAQQARTDAQTAATNAGTSATAAATSATNAANSATGLTATSTSSRTIGGGSITFTVQAGKQFVPGVNVKAVDAGNAARALYGTVSSYSGTNLTINVTTFEGSGTVANWNISVVGQRGVQGPLGGGRPFTETSLTAGGTWVSDAEDFKVVLQAPGSGGNQLLGGSSGGYVEKTFRGVPLGTVCTYIQGAAGLGTTGANANGTDGGDSTFTVPGFGALTAGGGKVQGFVGNNPPAGSRVGGTASGGDLNIPGQIGDDYSLYVYVDQPLVNFPRKGGNGAASPLGRGGVGRAAADITNAAAATGYGAGGGGASESRNSSPTTGNASAGAPGILRISR